MLHRTSVTDRGDLGHPTCVTDSPGKLRGGRVNICA